MTGSNGRLENLTLKMKIQADKKQRRDFRQICLKFEIDFIDT